MKQKLPAGVWVLGFVSLLMDVSSEMIHSLLPVYLVTAMGASMMTVGIIEGVAEAIAAIVKVFSGTLSDILGKRKWIAAFGYGLGALTKPFFALAGSVGVIAGARFVDRIGKGIRGAPRDAMVADLAPPEARGAAFGLRQSLDNIGAVAGPLLALVLMASSGNDFRLVFWLAFIPACLSVALIVFGVKESAVPPLPGEEKKIRFDFQEFRQLPGAFWLVVVVGAVFTLARFSEAFLILKAQDAGFPIAAVPLILIIMNIAYSLSAYPAGVLSDRIGRHGILILGLLILISADLVLSTADTLPEITAGVFLWGLHMGLTQGIFAAMVADTTPTRRHGTAFGVFNMVAGVALLLASLTAGVLWDIFGAQGTFLAGACFAFLSLALLYFRKKLKLS